MELNAENSVQSAANQLSSLLQSEQSLPPAEEEKEVQGAQAEEHEAMPSAEAAEPETLESDTEARPNLHKVKVDGQEVEVDYEELVKGYSRENHYQKNMRELSDKRKAIEENAQKIDEQLSEAESLLDLELSKFETPEMLRLKEDDPTEYWEKFDKVKAKVDKFEKLKASRVEEHQAKMRKQIEQEQKLMFDQFPHWNGDQKTMEAEVKDLFGVLGELGYSNQELENMQDHRLLVMAKKLQRLNEFEKASLEANEVKTKPKTMKAGTTTSGESREKSEVKAVRDRFKQTGSIRDAVDLLRATS